MNKPKESKTCLACGRPFTNRKRWKSRGQWDEVRYCSVRCRNARKTERSRTAS